MNARVLAMGVMAGKRVAVAKAITALESGQRGSESILGLISTRTGRAFVIGVTGPPGTGKSSVVDRLISNYRRLGLKVAVIAIDPSSPITGGALLGDRVRMLGHSGDDGVFIRSMATRGWTGGLSRAATQAVQVLDAAGFDVIIVETAGIGQSDIEVVNIAHAVVVVLMPELGDDVQASKAGLMEVGDVYVVNKSDLEGADKTVVNLLSAIRDSPGRSAPVLKVSALKNEGFEALLGVLEGLRERFKNSGTDMRIRSARGMLLGMAKGIVLERLERRSAGKLADRLAKDVVSGKVSLAEAASILAGRG